MPVNVKKLDPKFKFEVMEQPGGENITRCFACGTCTAGCPVREIDERYNPRKIIHMVLLGMKEEVLKSDFIWLCSACYTCHERCPQDVRITDLMTALKNLAVKYGYIHPSFVAQVDALKTHGGLYEIADFDNKKRTKLGLPEIKRNPEEMTRIFERTGILEHIKEEK